MSTVAVLKPDHLGDLVLSVPAIRAVSASGARVGLFVASASRTLARFLFPDIADIRGVDLRHLSRRGEEGTPHEALVQQLNEFDRVLCLRDDPVMRSIVDQLRVPYEIASGGHLTHETSIQKQAAVRICGPYSRTRLFCGVAHAWPESPRHVALCLAAGFPTNRWANVQWADLAQRLHRRGIGITLLGGPGERDDLHMLSRLLRRIEHDVVVGDDDFAGLFEALAPVDLVVATDGGTAHICSLRKPICSIFGSSPWRRYAPFGRANVVITRDEPCAPCVQFSTREVNGCMTRECMARIEPAKVLKVILSNGLDFSAIGGVRVERGVSHCYEAGGDEPARNMAAPATTAMPPDGIDVSDTEAVREFVAKSDLLGGPNSDQTTAFWREARFKLPAWLRDRAAQLHPLSRDYADLQNLLYLMVAGRPYADLASEATPFDKELAVRGLLAYPNRSPKNLNLYFHAMAKLSDIFDGDVCKDLLDLGSGWGFTSEYMARLGHRVVAVDINPDFVEVGRRRSKENRLGIDYRVGTFDHLPLAPEEQFDVVMSFESFHHCREPLAALRAMADHLRAEGQVILAGEPFIGSDVWPAWGLRLDPLSIYCTAKFGWWESGWTREYMGYLFRGVGLRSEMVDFHADMERYFGGRRALNFSAEQITWAPTVAGWRQDREYLISTGTSTLEFLRPLKGVVLQIENFSPLPLKLALSSSRLSCALAATLSPGSNHVSVPFDRAPPDDLWSLSLQGEVWCPDSVLGNGDRSEISFHLSGLEEITEADATLEFGSATETLRTTAPELGRMVIQSEVERAGTGERNVARPPQEQRKRAAGEIAPSNSSDREESEAEPGESKAVKSIDLAGAPTRFEGRSDDPYFKQLEANAAGLRELAVLIDRHVPRSANVLDVGANIGLSTILLAHRVARVIAYEPSPTNLGYLRRNLALNGIGNVEVIGAAASSEPGELRFHLGLFGAGSHVVGVNHLARERLPTITVPAVPLDSQSLPPIAFAKLDAEGHEPEVLAGARDLLARDRPLIYSEINIWCLCAFAGHSPGAYVRTLWEAFEVFSVAADGELTPLPNPYGFLHDIITSRGGVADVVLRPREGHAMPTLPQLSWPAPALASRG